MSDATAQLLLQTPMGPCLLTASQERVTRIQFGEALVPSLTSNAIALQAGRALEEYFQGQREQFERDWFAWQGTPFQRQVWDALWDIPYGRTRSYLEIGILIANKKAVRAIGRCVGNNPLPIVVPCHRVIGSDGALTGFALGLENKRWLLELEQSKHYGKQQSLFF
jgi:methylated-DNA-[protein]-cysteine S-methyltransferase